MDGIKGRGQYVSMMVLRTSTGKGGIRSVIRRLQDTWNSVG